MTHAAIMTAADLAELGFHTTSTGDKITLTATITREEIGRLRPCENLGRFAAELRKQIGQ